MTDPDFDELDSLHRTGIITEIEYAEAREKLQARADFDLLTPSAQGLDTDAESDGYAATHASADPSEHAFSHSFSTPLSPAQPRHAAPRGRHAKQPRRWPWIAGSVVVLAAAVVVGVVLRPTAHHTGSTAHSSAPPQAAGRSSAIVVASPANTAMTIETGGGGAQVAVSRLTRATGPAAAPTTTYTATVTVSGVAGAFAIAPADFTAHALSGRSYPVASTPLTTLGTMTVRPGQHSTGAIAFTVPADEHIEVVLFTTALGEQLGLWSTF